MRSALVERTPRPAVIAAALAIGIVSGVAAVSLDVKVFAAIVVTAAFVWALWRVWLEPKLGFYLVIVAFSLDSLGKLPLTDKFPLTVYQVVIAVFLAAAIRDRLAGRLSLEWKKTPLDLPILCFAGLAFLSVGFAPDLRLSLMAFASLASSIVLFYLILAIVEDPRDARNLVYWWLAVATVLALLAIAERVTGVSIAGKAYVSYAAGIRIRGSFKDPNMFGMLLMTALAGGLPMAMGEKGRTRAILVGMMGVCLVALVLTFSRGALGAFLIATAAIVLAYPGNRLKRLVPLVAGLALLLAVISYAGPSRFVQTKLMSLSQDTSTLARISMAQSGIEIIRRSPLGIGLGNFPRVYPEYRIGGLRPALVESHTTYLTIAVELGVLGLALFLWLAWRFFAVVWPDLRSGSKGLTGRVEIAAFAAVLGILAQAWVYSLEFSKQLWFAMGLGVAAHLMARHGKGADD